MDISNIMLQIPDGQKLDSIWINVPDGQKIDSVWIQVPEPKNIPKLERVLLTQLGTITNKWSISIDVDQITYENAKNGKDPITMSLELKNTGLHIIDFSNFAYTNDDYRTIQVTDVIPIDVNDFGSYSATISNSQGTSNVYTGVVEV